MYEGIHYPRDVLAGAAIGASMASLYAKVGDGTATVTPLVLLTPCAMPCLTVRLPWPTLAQFFKSVVGYFKRQSLGRQMLLLQLIPLAFYGALRVGYARVTKARDPKEWESTATVLPKNSGACVVWPAAPAVAMQPPESHVVSTPHGNVHRVWMCQARSC